MDFETILFLIFLYRISSTSRAHALCRKQSTMRKGFMMARAKRRQFFLFMNTAASFLPPQEANLLREARWCWSIEGPPLWFESVWGSEELNALDDYRRQEFRFSKTTFQEVIQIVRRDLEKRNTNFRQAKKISKYLLKNVLQ